MAPPAREQAIRACRICRRRAIVGVVMPRGVAQPVLPVAGIAFHFSGCML